MAVYPGMKPMLDFTRLPSRAQGRIRKRRKAVKTPENPRVRSICLSQQSSQGGGGVSLSDTTGVKWVSPQFDDCFQRSRAPLATSTTTNTTATAVGRRRPRVVKPLQVNIPGPNPRRGKENALKRAVSTQQQQRKKGSESRSKLFVLQKADENLVVTDKRELHVAVPLHQKSRSTKVAATDNGTRSKKLPHSRQHTPTTASTEPGLSDVIQDLSSDLENFSMNSFDMEFEQPPLAGFRTATRQLRPARSETHDSRCRHPSEVSSSTQQASVSTSRSYDPQRPVVSRLGVDKDGEPGGDPDETRGLETTATHQTPAGHLKAGKVLPGQNLNPLAQDAASQKRVISETPYKPPDHHPLSEERVENLSNMIYDMSLEDVTHTAAESQHNIVKTDPSHPHCLATTAGDRFEISSFRPPSASTPYHDTRPRHTGSTARSHSKPQDSNFRNFKKSSTERTIALHSQAAHSTHSSLEDDRATILAPETPAHLWDVCGSTVRAARLRPVTVRASETFTVRDSFS